MCYSILQQPHSYEQWIKLLFVCKRGHTRTPINFVSLTSILIMLMPDASLKVSVIQPDLASEPVSMEARQMRPSQQKHLVDGSGKAAIAEWHVHPAVGPSCGPVQLG
ncbi:hypothetical protein DPX16_8631 [Anabarilius grahami]|uniref:Uncharacterized protein n=1 Tax=Anabarilius grahami TaxID=495550 RepID=A0A3N0Z103_ANAGA|nr:hypothetical protein DPX16_8631 [Anabarilius grahami]